MQRQNTRTKRPLPPAPSRSILSPKKLRNFRSNGENSYFRRGADAGLQTQNVKDIYFSALDQQFLYCVEIDDVWEEEVVSLVNTSEYVQQQIRDDAGNFGVVQKCLRRFPDSLTTWEVKIYVTSIVYEVDRSALESILVSDRWSGYSLPACVLSEALDVSVKPASTIIILGTTNTDDNASLTVMHSTGTKNELICINTEVVETNAHLLTSAHRDAYRIFILGKVASDFRTSKSYVLVKMKDSKDSKSILCTCNSGGKGTCSRGVVIIFKTRFIFLPYVFLVSCFCDCG